MDEQSFSKYRVERRRAERYSIVCPVELENGNGMTCNQSIVGLLFKTDEPFTVGCAIGLFVLLECDENTFTRIHCQGTVVRIEPNSGQWNIAVDIKSFRFAHR